MRRRSLSEPELDLLQKLKRENQKLKRQINALRKQLDRVDLDHFQNLKEVLDSQDREEQEEAAKEEQQSQQKAWECWNCHQDYLRLTVLERRDGVHYYRKCGTCNHRTKLQKYTDKVGGPK